MGNVDTNNRTAVLLVTCTHFLGFQKKTTKSQLFQKFRREEVFYWKWERWKEQTISRPCLKLVSDAHLAKETTKMQLSQAFRRGKKLKCSCSGVQKLKGENKQNLAGIKKGKGRCNKQSATNFNQSLRFWNNFSLPAVPSYTLLDTSATFNQSLWRHFSHEVGLPHQTSFSSLQYCTILIFSLI